MPVDRATGPKKPMQDLNHNGVDDQIERMFAVNFKAAGMGTNPRAVEAAARRRQMSFIQGTMKSSWD